MEPEILVAVDVPQVGEERRKNWAKVVTSVDDTLATGWAFDGTFVATGGIQDLPVGAVVVVYGEKGSMRTPTIEARVYTVNDDATLTLQQAAKGRAWARTLRDRVEELLAHRESTPPSQGWHPDLMRFSDEALREELRRRE